ncbi:MAG: serpin family protein [Anaerolineae bacterium]|nr:serpin family protein [Anaerolineae bacterium]
MSWVMRVFVLGLLCVLSLTIVSAREVPLVVPSDSEAFSLALYDQLRSAEGNLFFSPYSINNAFLMTYVGARGDTAQQMRDVLRIIADDENLNQIFADYNAEIITHNNAVKDEYTSERILAVSNALWIQQDFALSPDYPTTLTDFYNASITPLDFVNAPDEARQLINETIAEQTRQRILDLIPDGVIDAMTRLILTNAVYFKANWQNPFTPVESAPFNLLDGTVLDIPAMMADKRMGYYAENGVISVAIPYSGGASQMVIVMPNDWASYEAGVSENGLPDMLSAPNYVQVMLTMPKFEFESSFSLSDALINMGMTDAFNPDVADFSGMADADLFIQEALHKAFIAVDENGTEAAAATAVIIGVTSMPMPVEPIVVNIDKPFLFYIQDTATGEILFMGRVLNPSE